VIDAAETQNADREHWDHLITNLQTSHTEIMVSKRPIKSLTYVDGLKLRLHPDDVERGHKRPFAAEITAASSAVGQIIPPSIPLAGIRLCTGRGFDIPQFDPACLLVGAL
jgi:hypothetical protein